MSQYHTIRKIAAVVCVAVLAGLLACGPGLEDSGASNEKTRGRPAPGKRSPQAPRATSTLAESGKQEKLYFKGKADDREGDQDGTPAANRKRTGLTPAFITNLPAAEKRLLEYSITLTFECKDLHAARAHLLDIISKYGFINQSRATTEQRRPSMSLSISVQVEKVYQALLDIDKVGKLVQERINVTDHTPDMAWTRIRLRREQLRNARKLRAATQGPAAARNWQERENSLQQNEDQMDRQSHKQWQIRDRVAWARVNIRLKAPEQKTVQVPDYVDALRNAAEVMLQLLYGLLFLLPFAVIGFLIYLGIRRLIKWKAK